MQFDQQNKVIQLCAKGMEQEGAGNAEAAAQLFTQAWQEADTDFEKFTAAHYVARHQPSIEDKLRWDETALLHAMNMDTEEMRAAYPSLYLNIAKCHEDLGDMEKAKEYYLLANLYVTYLGEDGYSTMIKKGILNGLERVDI